MLLRTWSPDDIKITTETGVLAGGFLTVCTGPDNFLSCSFGSRPYERATGTLKVQVLAGAINERLHGPSQASDPMYVAGHNWAVSVADASATEGAGATIDFEVSLNARDDCREVRVDYANGGRHCDGRVGLHGRERNADFCARRNHENSVGGRDRRCG